MFTTAVKRPQTLRRPPLLSTDFPELDRGRRYVVECQFRAADLRKRRDLNGAELVATRPDQNGRHG
jgi:hypothetical protein